MSIWRILSTWDYDGAYTDIYGPFCCRIDIFIAAYSIERMGDITIRVLYWVRKGQFTEMHGDYTDTHLIVR